MDTRVDPSMGGTDDAGARDAAASADVAGGPRSGWLEMREMVPDLVRLLRALATDPRVPVRAKLVAGAAVGYAVLPIGRLPSLVPGVGVGVDDVVALVFAVRHLLGAAGYDLVRELWTGTDGGFGLLVVLAGVDR